ncbi:MAG: ATP-grasp domain-containing protein, partial [Candidatus Eremiobacteraeota bacterium]|nr:ATP-grasp domain-containing protein [Candidatus Eremiobacteraeota bacterium]
AAVTTEFENVPAEALRRLALHCVVSPGADSVAVAQDRIREKRFLAGVGLDTAPFAVIEGPADLDRLDPALLPGILKRARFGYDGKGQWDLSRSRPQPGVTCICEEKLAFQRELSQIGVRSRSGEIACYPLVETIQREGILCEAIAPARQVSQELVNQARLWVTKILEALDYVGVLALELFEVDGQLLANEMAPRVHNSGHWTDRGCRTSQFENHWRALLGWPLGDTEALGHCRLINLLGSVPEVPPPGVHATYYGKEARPGRKLGHLTCLADTPEAVDEISSGVLSHAT